MLTECLVSQILVSGGFSQTAALAGSVGVGFGPLQHWTDTDMNSLAH